MHAVQDGTWARRCVGRHVEYTDLPHEAVVVTELDLGDADLAARVRPVARAAPHAATAAGRRAAADAVMQQTGDRTAKYLQTFRQWERRLNVSSQDDRAGTQFMGRGGCEEGGNTFRRIRPTFNGKSN